VGEVVMVCERIVNNLLKPGTVKTIKADKHSFAFRGNIPCTGPRVCIYCGYIEGTREYCNLSVVNCICNHEEL
jgi:hypothetical protein